MLKKQVEQTKEKKEKSVPKYVLSGKHIAQEKKNLKVKDEDGNMISMEEALAKSKKGEKGKGKRWIATLE